VNTIKDLSPPGAEEIPEPIQEDGVLGELWQCVGKMREYNSTLNESKESLIRLIG
jgi:hypothetical protein